MNRRVIILILTAVMAVGCSSSPSADELADTDTLLDRHLRIRTLLGGTIDNLRAADRELYEVTQADIERCMTDQGLDYVRQLEIVFYTLSTEGFDTTRHTYSGWLSPTSIEAAEAQGLGLEYSSANAALAFSFLMEFGEDHPRAAGEGTPTWDSAQNTCVENLRIPDVRPDVVQALTVELTLLEAELFEDLALTSEYAECMEAAGWTEIASPSELIERLAFTLYQDVDGVPVDGSGGSDQWLADRATEREAAVDDATCRQPIIEQIAPALTEKLDEFEARNQLALREVADAWALLGS